MLARVGYCSHRHFLICGCTELDSNPFFVCLIASRNSVVCVHPNHDKSCWAFSPYGHHPFSLLVFSDKCLEALPLKLWFQDLQLCPTEHVLGFTFLPHQSPSPFLPPSLPCLDCLCSFLIVPVKFFLLFLFFVLPLCTFSLLHFSFFTQLLN